MAALVQSFPSPSSTITMLQTRPSSSDAFQNGSQNHQHRGNSQMSRNMYNMGGMAPTSYRGHTSMASVPVAQYAFNATPGLAGSNPLRQHPTASPHLRQENRTTSAPALPFTQQSFNAPNALNRYRQPAGSTPLDPSNPHTLPQPSNTKDDSSILSQTTRQFPQRPQSAIDLGSLSTLPSANANLGKSSPDRYRRVHRPAGVATPNGSAQGGSALPSGSGMATVGHLYSNPAHSNSSPSLSTYPTPRTYNNEPSSTAKRLSATVDDLSLPKQTTPELAKRYRRRSIASMEAGDHVNEPQEASLQAPQPKTYAAMLASPAPQERKETRPAATAPQRPGSAHGRNDSGESSISGRSGSRPPSVCAHRAIDSNVSLESTLGFNPVVQYDC